MKNKDPAQPKINPKKDYSGEEAAALGVAFTSRAEGAKGYARVCCRPREGEGPRATLKAARWEETRRAPGAERKQRRWSPASLPQSEALFRPEK